MEVAVYLYDSDHNLLVVHPALILNCEGNDLGVIVAVHNNNAIVCSNRKLLRQIETDHLAHHISFDWLLIL
jgi:hypothetical protein